MSREASAYLNVVHELLNLWWRAQAMVSLAGSPVRRTKLEDTGVRSATRCNPARRPSIPYACSPCLHSILMVGSG